MKQIAGYRVLGLLGRGGMASVYKVQFENQPIKALKLLDPRPELIALWGEAEVRRRFLGEAQALHDIKNPNLVEVGRVSSEEPVFYLMEYFCRDLGSLIGVGLRPEAPTRPLGLDLALNYGAQALAGLGALHDAGIVHRDFKPANLLLADDGQVKLSDLGLSRLRGEERPVPPNLLVGSPEYAAPEQVAHPENASPASDLYSLGVTLYQLLCGRLPGRQPVLASQINPDLDSAWDEFFTQTLAPDPARRFQSAPETAAALAKLQEAWQARKPQVCAAELAPGNGAPAAPLPLRTEPLKVPLAGARAAFDLDELWRPRQYWPRDFQDQGQGTVLHPATGLLWQKSGSLQPLTWDQAPAYVAALNARRLGGKGGWCLPSLPELLTLLGAPDQHDFCGPQDFDPLADRLWSADRCTFTSAWHLSLSVGFAGRQDFTCHNFVRAVCSDSM